MQVENWRDYALNEILQWLANAYVTYANALGHSKAQANWALVSQYRAELIERGMGIPSLETGEHSKFKDDLCEFGELNGQGSY